MNTQEKTIRLLKNKIRNLENDLCERTRNYLLHKGIKNSIIPRKIDQIVQTDHDHLELSNYSQYLHNISPSIGPLSASVQRSDMKMHSKNVDVSEFIIPEREQYSNTRRKISAMLEQLKEQRRKVDESVQTASVADSASCELNMQEDFDRQKQRLRRQIKKVTARLQFQQKINQIAKEGLLISEEENYQFRLKITELLKSQTNQESQIQQIKETKNNVEVEMLRNQIINIQAALDHERQVKEQYLETSLELQDQIHTLTEENFKLKNLIVQVTQLNENENKTNIIREVLQNTDYSENSKIIDQEIFEKIKLIAYSISNCVPATSSTAQINYFQPENESEVLQVLKRVEEYCREIERWELQKIESMNKEKKVFIDFINKISSHLSVDARENIMSQVIKIQQMRHFLSIFKEKERTTSNPYLEQIQDSVMEMQKL